MLRGLVVCGYCGSMASGTVSNRHTYYSCGAKRNKNLTTTPHDERVAISHKKLDEKVWQGLVQLLDDPEQLKFRLVRKAEKIDHASQAENTILAKIEQRIEKLSLQEQRLLDAYRENVIDLDELRKQKVKVSNQLQVLKAQQKASQNDQEGQGATQISFSDLQDLSTVYKRAMSKANFADKEKIANLLISRVKLYPEKAIIDGVIPVELDALKKAQQAALHIFSNLGFIALPDTLSI